MGSTNTTSALGAADGIEIGYWLSSEEFAAPVLVRNAVEAEAAGFGTAMISDHFAPWIPRQGHSPFVWSTLGGIATQTRTLRVGVGVAAMLHRSHPVNVAQAAATIETMMPGRFFLGLGTGERLNEHVVDASWPAARHRREALREAIDIIRDLWAGKTVTRDGFFTADRAKLYTRPDTAPPIVVAASGKQTAQLAGELADGLLGLTPDPDVVEAFAVAGGEGRPRLAQLHVCWAESERDARATAHKYWPIAALPARILTELALPQDFAAAARLVDEDAVAERIPCGPDPAVHAAAVQRLVGAGYTTVYVHQVGPDQAGFIDYCKRTLLPELGCR
jgi:G6PDH family F420-dependent oxidoreductase